MNLTDAKELLAWMREEGVVCARVGDVALTVHPDQQRPGAWAETPYTQHLREQAHKTKKAYASPEEDPDLYGLEQAPGLND